MTPLNDICGDVDWRGERETTGQPSKSAYFANSKQTGQHEANDTTMVARPLTGPRRASQRFERTSFMCTAVLKF